MTQRELAERLSVSHKTVSRWECDETLPDLYILPKICGVFGVTADEIINAERKKTEAEPPSEVVITEKIIIKEEIKSPAFDAEKLVSETLAKLSVRLVISVFVSLFVSVISVGMMYERMYEFGIALSLASALGVIMYSVISEIKILSETVFCKRKIGKTAFFTVNALRIKSVRNACLSGSIAVFITVVTIAFSHLGDIVELLLCTVFYVPPTLVGCGIIYAVIISRLYRRGIIERNEY